MDAGVGSACLYLVRHRWEQKKLKASLSWRLPREKGL